MDFIEVKNKKSFDNTIVYCPQSANLYQVTQPFSTVKPISTRPYSTEHFNALSQKSSWRYYFFGIV